MPGNKKSSQTMKEKYGPQIFEAMGQGGGVAAKISGRYYHFQNPEAARAAQAKGVANKRKRKGKS